MNRIMFLCGFSFGLLFAIVVVVVNGYIQHVGIANTETVVVPVLPPCEYEDSANCFWDAGTSGNGEGTSFVDVNGTAYYPEYDGWNQEACEGIENTEGC